ncbi:cytochrome P450 [Cubamyces sp. BRFM 1775]|nr:cytochrome P450 [Cubamyces sp. BRFM 1775]
MNMEMHRLVQCISPLPPSSDTMLSVDVTSALVTALLVFIGSRIYNYFKFAKQTGYLPGLRSFATPISILGASLPTGRFNPGLNWQWEWRKHVYARYGTETISSLPYLFGEPAIYTSSLEVARQVLSPRGGFYKSREFTATTLEWGPNLLAANGEEWKRFRRIVAPAFDQSMYASLWADTAAVFDEMVKSEGWTTKATVEIPNTNPLTNKLALIVISTTGFGHPLPWSLKGSSASDEMSFGEALYMVTHNFILRLVLPRWAYLLPIKKFRDLEKAAQIHQSFMRDLIRTRREEFSAGATPNSDILSLMIQSAENKGKFSMTDAELVGNTAIMLFAGHDTMALTLNAAMGFMALHPEFQEEMYCEVMEAMPTEAYFTYTNCSKLRKTQACFLEASRIYPAGFMLIRNTEEDIILEHVGPNRDQRVLVPKETRIVVDTIGLHHNPRLFPDPEVFKPERWYDAPDNSMSMFSVGSRACIGRRFAITEAACFLAKLVRDWRVEILTRDGETKAEWEEKYMNGKPISNFGIVEMPVRLVRRTSW